MLDYLFEPPGVKLVSPLVSTEVQMKHLPPLKPKHTLSFSAIRDVLTEQKSIHTLVQPRPN